MDRVAEAKTEGVRTQDLGRLPGRTTPCTCRVGVSLPSLLHPAAFSSNLSRFNSIISRPHRIFVELEQEIMVRSTTAGIRLPIRW
jgi:hypothetical protein